MAACPLDELLACAQLTAGGGGDWSQAAETIGRFGGAAPAERGGKGARHNF